MVISIVVVVPHWLASGVKVYVVVPNAVVLIVAGLQLPVIRLLEVVGNTGAVLLRHNGPIGSKLDTTELAMVMSTDTAEAHCPTVGVKVYVVVPNTVVLIFAGLQAPVMPLLDVFGSTGAALFRQSAPIVLKVGVTPGVTVISIVVAAAH